MMQSCFHVGAKLEGIPVEQSGRDCSAYHRQCQSQGVLCFGPIKCQENSPHNPSSPAPSDHSQEQSMYGKYHHFLMFDETDQIPSIPLPCDEDIFITGSDNNH